MAKKEDSYTDIGDSVITNSTAFGDVTSPTANNSWWTLNKEKYHLPVIYRVVPFSAIKNVPLYNYKMKLHSKDQMMVYNFQPYKYSVGHLKVVWSMG